MNDPQLIFDQLREYIKPNDNNTIRRSTFTYLYSVILVNRLSSYIIPKFKSIIKTILYIIKNYYEENPNEIHRIYDLQIKEKKNWNEFRTFRNSTWIDYAIKILCGEDTNKYNTGVITKSGLRVIINHIMRDLPINDELNIRECLCIIDQFIYYGCEPLSWFIYVKFCGNNIPQELNGLLNNSNINKKICEIAKIISGSNQQWFTIEPKNIVPTKKLIFDMLGKRIRDKDTFDYPWKDNSRICQFLTNAYFFYPNFIYSSDIQFQRKTVVKCNRKPFMAKNIAYPPLSKRELSHINNVNSDHANTGIHWEGGCHYSTPNLLGVSFGLAKANRKDISISNSRHTIVNMELLSLFVGFEEWKEIYVFCLMATMIPYCHHTAHEILNASTYKGITYNFKSSYEGNFSNMVDLIIQNHGNVKNISSLRELSRYVLGMLNVISYEQRGGSNNYKKKYLKYKKKYMMAKNISQ